MKRFLALWLIASVAACWLVGASAAGKAITVYIDTTGINNRSDLTQTQKDEVVKAMEDEVKSNLEQSVGTGNVTVGHDENTKKNADRTITTENTVGSGTDKDGKATYHWGDWSHGSNNTTVHVGTYMDDPPGVSSSFKKPDKSWDTSKLGKAMGTTGSHEVMHSFSAGHDDTNTNKMNTANSGTQIAGGLSPNAAAQKVVGDNSGNPPCATVPGTIVAKSTVCANWWADPFAGGPFGFVHETRLINTAFSFDGPLAGMFDFGWWSVDGDNGLNDGNAFADFALKSTMAAPTDAPMITFFDGWTADFVLRGKPGTPFAGQYFSIDPALIGLNGWAWRPDGLMVAGEVDLMWEVDSIPGPDVRVNLNAQAVPGSCPFSGFTLEVPPPMRIGEAKLRCDGHFLTLHGNLITLRTEDGFYIESPDRSSGIKVVWPDVVMPEYPVTVKGKMATGPGGEREILAVEVSVMVSPIPPLPVRPLSISNGAIGAAGFHYVPGKWPSGQMGVSGGVGLNNLGLLVRTCGWASPSPFPAYPEAFILSDGSPEPLKVVCPPGVPLPPPGGFISVNGVSSCERPVSSEPPRRLLIARDWMPL